MEGELGCIVETITYIKNRVHFEQYRKLKYKITNRENEQRKGESCLIESFVSRFTRVYPVTVHIYCLGKICAENEIE